MQALLAVLLCIQNDVRDAVWAVRDVGDGVKVAEREWKGLYGTNNRMAMLDVEIQSGVFARGAKGAPSSAGGCGAVGVGVPGAPLKIDGTLVAKGMPAWPAVGALTLGSEKSAIRPAIARIAKEEDLSGARHAFCGPLLLDKTKRTEGLDGDAWPKEVRDRQPRVLAALAKGGKRLLLYCVQGDGLSLVECQRFLVDVGCESGVVIGGSAGLWVAARKDGSVMPGGEASLAIDAPVMVVVDNGDAECKPSKEWTVKNDGKGMYLSDYLANVAGAGDVAYTVHVPAAGTYDVAVIYPFVDGKGGSVSVTVGTAAGDKVVGSVPQFKNAGAWFTVGTWELAAGETKITIKTITSIGNAVRADAVRIVKRK